MPRRRLLNLLAAPLAAWFALGALLPAFDSPCAVHEPALAQLAAGIATMPVHDAPAAAHHQHGSHSSHGAHSCNCVGCGTCASAFSLPSNAVAIAPATVALDAGSRPSAIVSRIARAPDHSHPFSTAPPALNG